MPPFTVLHVCMGNICRSPMAERLTLLEAARALPAMVAPGSAAGPATIDDLLLSHSAGTGGWHAGEPMNPPAARLVTARGGAVDTFAARKLRGEHIDAADLVLTATADQQHYVVALRPDAAGRTFVLGEFGRLLKQVDPAALPAARPEPDAVYARGVALVEAVDTERSGRPARPEDDLDDPWGHGDAYFQRVGDEIEATIRPLVRTLLGLPAEA